MDDAGVEALREAIRHMHGCDSRWVESMPVREMFNGQVVWDGEVQVFELVGHAKATRAYAWSEATEGERRRFSAVLDLYPVSSPVDAVRVSIVSRAKTV